MSSYTKPTCCKNISYKHHGQLGFHFLMVFKKHRKELESIIFYGIKAKIYGDKKNVVSVSYITIFGFLVYNSLRILNHMTLFR